MILRVALTVWWKSYGTTGGGGGADGSGMSDGTDATTNPNSVLHLLMKEHTMNLSTPCPASSRYYGSLAS